MALIKPNAYPSHIFIGTPVTDWTAIHTITQAITKSIVLKFLLPSLFLSDIIIPLTPFKGHIPAPQARI